MRNIIELKAKIKDRNFFLSQFKKSGTKNILFVNPMLSGKDLYKALLPYFKLSEIQGIETAVTNLTEFDMNEKLVGYKAIDIMSSPDSDLMIKWATHIVFPFTLQPLNEIYAHIRSVNPACKCLYSIDFNYYELSPSHPLVNTFDNDIIIPIVEDNMYFSDTVLVTNAALQQYFIEKLSELVQTNYIGVSRGSKYDLIQVNLLPFCMDEKIVLDNVDYDTNNLIFKVPVPIPEKAPEIATSSIVEKKPEIPKKSAKNNLPVSKNNSTLAPVKRKTPQVKGSKKKSVIKKTPKGKGKKKK